MVNVQLNVVCRIKVEPFALIPFAQDFHFSFGPTVDRTDPLFFAKLNYFIQQRTANALIAVMLRHLNKFQAVAYARSS